MPKNVPEPEPTFRSKQIARIYGVSLRQLQCWDEHKLIQPQHEGHHRLYGVQEAVMVGVVHELRLKGISLQRIRAILRAVNADVKHCRAAWGKLTNWCLTVPANLKGHFVTTDRGAVEVAIAAKGLVGMVSISEQIRKVEAHVVAARERTKLLPHK